MKNALRCCISCILPCGVLDVIRIVHTNGRVEEITGDVTAAEIMKMHPKHVLKKPSSRSVVDGDQGACPKIVVVPPEAHLQRGKIYFLIPVLSPAPEKPRTKSSSAKKKRSSSSEVEQKRRSKQSNAAAAGVIVSDQYLSEILSEKLSTPQRDRRRGRVGVWRPHLESISETPSVYQCVKSYVRTVSFLEVEWKALVMAGGAVG
nr:CBL-interacting serine/threonine-protein kinase 7-like [Ipomoea trifida]